MPAWIVLIVKIIVLLVTHFAVFKAGEIKEEGRNRPLREAIERMKSNKCDCVPAMKCRCQLCLESDKRPREIWIDEKDGPQPMTPEEFKKLQERLRMQKQIDTDFRKWMSENHPGLSQPPEGQRWQPYYDIWIGKHWRDYPGFWDAADGN